MRLVLRGARVRLQCYNEALPGQVEHEMLRSVPGTRVTIERCGSGYVVVSTDDRGTIVVWQASDQAFCRANNIADTAPLAPLVNRLGSIIPADYKVSVDRWVLNEIRWRVQWRDHYHRRRKESRRGSSMVGLS
jgi:hypothetical protein